MLYECCMRVMWLIKINCSAKKKKKCRRNLQNLPGNMNTNRWRDEISQTDPEQWDVWDRPGPAFLQTFMMDGCILRPSTYKRGSRGWKEIFKVPLLVCHARLHASNNINSRWTNIGSKMCSVLYFLFALILPKYAQMYINLGKESG